MTSTKLHLGEGMIEHVTTVVGFFADSSALLISPYLAPCLKKVPILRCRILHTKGYLEKLYGRCVSTCR